MAIAIHIPSLPKAAKEDKYFAKGTRISHKDTIEKIIVGSVSPAPLNIPFVININAKGIYEIPTIRRYRLPISNTETSVVKGAILS